jgi:integrase
MADEKAKRPRGTGCIFHAGSANWWIGYYRGGKLIRENTKSTKKSVAKGMLQTRLAEVASETWISPADRKITVDKCYAELLDHYRANEMDSAVKGARERWELADKDGDKPKPGRLQKFFAGRRAVAITTDLLNKYVNGCRETGLSNATINRDLAALRRALNLARMAGKVQKLPAFPHLKEAAPRSGFVDESVYVKLAANATELWLRSLLACGYNFGFRKGELLNLKVGQVDLAARTIRLNAGETKSGDGRVIKMTDDVYVLLTACVSGKKAADYVFSRANGKRVKDFRDSWTNLCTKAGVPELLFHDLRRSAVRNMERAGVPRSWATKISGHKTESVYRRYAIVSEADLADATRRIEAGKAIHSDNIQSLAKDAKDTSKGQEGGSVSNRPN